MAFKGLNDAGEDRGVKLGKGRYELQIDQISEFTSKNPKTKGDQYMVANFTVLQSTNAEHPVGAKRSWMTSCDEMGFVRIKSLLLAASGVTNPKDAQGIDLEEIANDAAGEKQTLKGSKVVAEAEPGVSKAGKEFTNVKFFAA